MSKSTPEQEQPREGGSYLRRADGSLELVSRTEPAPHPSAPDAEGQPDAEPAPQPETIPEPVSAKAAPVKKDT